MSIKAIAEGRKWNGYLCYEAVWGRGLCGLVSTPHTVEIEFLTTILNNALPTILNNALPFFIPLATRVSLNTRYV